MAVTIVAYIAHWCPDCVRSLRVLQRSGLPYVEIDIEKMPSAEDAMRAINGGSGKVPTILIDSSAGRRILIEPDDRELADALRTTPHSDLE